MLTGSKKDLLEYIKRNGTISIDDLADKMELAKTTLREHLLQMERDDYVARDYKRSGPGRPSLQYRITPKGNDLFPSHESVLARELLRFLKANGKESLMEDFFRQFWEKRLEKAREYFEQIPADTSDQERRGVLLEMLEEEGFMPEIDLNEKGNSFTVKECNCPFREVVKETRLPCKLEEMFYKKLLHPDAERSSYIADGDFSCTYEIPAT